MRLITWSAEIIYSPQNSMLNIPLASSIKRQVHRSRVSVHSSRIPRILSVNHSSIAPRRLKEASNQSPSISRKKARLFCGVAINYSVLRSRSPASTVIASASVRGRPLAIFLSRFELDSILKSNGVTAARVFFRVFG